MSRLTAVLSFQKRELIQALVFRLRVLDVLPDHLFIATYCRYKIPTRQKSLTHQKFRFLSP